MPGVIPHLVAGFAMFFIGLFCFRKYFADKNASEKMLLLGVCLLFSCVPDFFGGLYHVFHLLPFETVEPYHFSLHLIITPVSLVVLLLLKFKFDVKREPIWVMGFCCIVVHIVMDLFINEGSMWI